MASGHSLQGKKEKEKGRRKKEKEREEYEAKRFMGTVSGTPRARQNRNFPSVFDTQQPDSRRGLLEHGFRRHCGALKIEEKEEREREREREREEEKGRRKKEKEREEDDDDDDDDNDDDDDDDEMMR